MEKIRAAFFDVDGTLLPFGADNLPDSTRRALCLLREKGVLLFVATGRCISHLNHILQKIDFSFDGYVIMNGQFCYTQNETVWTYAFDREDIKGVLKFHELNPNAIWCMDELTKRHYNTLYDGSITDIDPNYRTPLSETLAQLISQKKDLYQVSATLTHEQEQQILELLPGCTSVHWHPSHVDIIPKAGGKCVGIEKMLAHFNLTNAQTITFGDGGNDISMIKAAGIGVAMGNAGDRVKESADYVTTDTDRDGILNALIHFNLID